MAVEIINCEQGTEEWLRARLGIPTASEFATILMNGKGGGDSKTRRKYMLRLVGERLTGEIEEGYKGQAMERGNEMEPEAADMYAFMFDVELEQVGFIRNGERGCSPDRLVGADGMVQIKTAKPSILLSIHEAGDTDKHIAQVQGEIWTAEREWNDLFVYWPKLQPFYKRVYRDDAYIKKLSEAMDIFLSELHELEHRHRIAA